MCKSFLVPKGKCIVFTDVWNFALPDEVSGDYITRISQTDCQSVSLIIRRNMKNPNAKLETSVQASGSDDSPKLIWIVSSDFLLRCPFC